MGFKDIIRYRKRQGFNSVAILACFPNWDDDGLPPRIVDEEGVVIRKAWPPRDYNEPAILRRRAYGPPPFGNLVSTNAGPSTLCQFGHVSDDAPWLTLHQIGNKREHDYYWYLTEIFHTESPVPALHGEPYYSGWGTQVSYHKEFAVPGNTPKDDRYVRSGMYGSFLSGGLAGYIYGCTGLVRAVNEPTPDWPTKIWVGLQWSSATMVRIFGKFVFCDGHRYRDLVPNADLISPSRDHNLRSYDGWAYCAWTADRDLFLVYFEKGIEPGYIRSALHDADYRAHWYDVRTGRWIDAGVFRSDDLETVDLPPKPTDDDWALRLKLAPASACGSTPGVDYR